MERFERAGKGVRVAAPITLPSLGTRPLLLTSGRPGGSNYIDRSSTGLVVSCVFVFVRAS